MDDTPGDLDFYPEFSRIQAELARAEKARAAGNEGQARVCARRAAGIAIGEYLKLRGLPIPGPSAYERLKYLCEIDDVSLLVQEAAQHLLLRVTPEFTLPVDVDLIAKARWLIAELYSNLPMPGEQSRHIPEGDTSIAEVEPIKPLFGEDMTPTYQLKKDLSLEIPEIPSDSIVSRTIYSDEQLKAVLFGFAQGQELSEHTASTPAIIHILSGEVTLILGGDKSDAQTGTWVHMPAHLPHSVIAKTPTTMLLLLLRDQ